MELHHPAKFNSIKPGSYFVGVPKRLGVPPINATRWRSAVHRHRAARPPAGWRSSAPAGPNTRRASFIAAPRLEALGIEVNHAISDRAKALIKLAVTGFECTSGADTFHEQYGLSRWLSPALGRRKAKADQCCELAQKALDQPSRGASTEEKAALAAQQACAWEARAQVEQAQQEYQKQLLGIAEEIHPFSLEENTRTTAESVVAGLETRAQALETLAAQQGIQDTRSALKKFRAQRPSPPGRTPGSPRRGAAVRARSPDSALRASSSVSGLKARPQRAKLRPCRSSPKRATTLSTSTRFWLSFAASTAVSTRRSMPMSWPRGRCGPAP
jgi:phage baseplate assembly protein W